jgi:hypothetical protein
MAEGDILRTFNFYISSKQRDSGVPNNFSIYLNQSFSLNTIIPSEFVCWIDRAQIPFSWSQFSEPNRNVQSSYTVSRNGTIYAGTFSIPAANYNIVSLANTFVEFLRESVNQVSGGLYTPSVSVSYSEDTNHLRFTLAGTNNTITFSNSPYSGLNRALGFGAAWQMNSALDYTESTQDCDVSPARCLYIKSGSLQQSQSYEAIQSKFTASSILTMIPINRAPILYLQHQPAYPIKTSLSNSIITELQFELTDESGVDLYEMDLDWSMHLVLQEVRLNEVILDANRRLGMFTPDILTAAERQQSKNLIEEFKKQQEDELKVLRDKQVKRLEKLTEKLEKKKIKSPPKRKKKDVNEKPEEEQQNPE